MSNKILLIEDNPDDIILITRALKKNHLINDIIVKRDGAEALDFFFGPDGDNQLDYESMPVLTLLDLNLPKIDGIEVLKKIRTNERTKLLPVVILTSSKDQGDLLTCYRLGCNSFIRKPMDFNQFNDAIKQLGLYWFLINEIPPRL